jgi:beta-lactamase class A
MRAQVASNLPKESPARAQIEQLIRQAHADVAIAFRALDGSQELFIKPDTGFSRATASIGLPLLMELQTEVSTGELKWADTVIVHDKFPSGATGGFYPLDPESDPDEELYRQIGKAVTLGELRDHLTKRGSTLAANLLAEKIGVERIQRRIRALKAQGFKFGNSAAQDAQEDTDEDDRATARSVFDLLWRLAKGQEAGDRASMEMIGQLARGQFPKASNEEAEHELRSAMRRMTPEAYQDATIVFGPHPFVAVIIVRGVPVEESRMELAALIEHALATELGPEI